MSPSLQASTSDLSLSAVPAEEAAEAEPEVGAPPPGPVAPPPVAPPGEGFNTVVIDLLFDFQTSQSQKCFRLALISKFNYNSIESHPCSSSRRVGTHPGESGGGLVEGARDGRGEALQDLRADRETAG